MGARAPVTSFKINSEPWNYFFFYILKQLSSYFSCSGEFMRISFALKAPENVLWTLFYFSPTSRFWANSSFKKTLAHSWHQTCWRGWRDDQNPPETPDNSPTSFHFLLTSDPSVVRPRPKPTRRKKSMKSSFFSFQTTREELVRRFVSLLLLNNLQFISDLLNWRPSDDLILMSLVSWFCSLISHVCC